MITVDMITAQLAKVGDSISYKVDTDDGETTIQVTVEDFGGFDAQWREIICPVDWKAVRALETWLETNADRIDDDYSTSYFFGKIEVWVKYASSDI